MLFYHFQLIFHGIIYKSNVIHSTLLSNIFYMLNTFSMYQIYEKTLLTGSHLGFLKWEK